MTLILTDVSAAYVLQVSDRLVSARDRPFDRVWNKSVIFLAKDGLVTMAFTGRAFVDGEPTDRWIARKLALDETLQDDGRGSIQNGFDLPERWLRLEEAVRHLGTELTRSFRRPANLLGSTFLHIRAAGWHWPSRGWRWILGRARPVVYDIHNEPKPGEFVIWTLPRYWGWEQHQFQLSAAPIGYLGSNQLENLTNQLRGAPSPNESEDVLVDAIRRASSQYPQRVGPHTMSVLLPRPSHRLVRTRYSPFISEEAAGQEVEPGYTPWVVAPDVIVSPTILNGSGHLEVPSGPFTFRFEGGTELVRRADGAIVVFASQPRPGDPQGPTGPARLLDPLRYPITG